MDDMCQKFINTLWIIVHDQKSTQSILQIMVFFINKIGQKGPENDIGQLDEGAILDKLISALSTLTSDFFLLTIPCPFD